jgi:hypothetical protein
VVCSTFSNPSVWHLENSKFLFLSTFQRWNLDLHIGEIAVPAESTSGSKTEQEREDPDTEAEDHVGGGAINSGRAKDGKRQVAAKKK